LSQFLIKNMKILLSAYFCEPGKGSEEGIGWNTVVQAAKHDEIWVLTRTENRLTIEVELAKNPIEKLHFVYFDLPFWTSKWEHGQRGIQFHYYLWQLWAYFIARPLQKEIGFNLMRHVTFVRYWSPSLISLLDVPFIWGPIGGGESAPKSFWRDFSFRGKVYETIRDVVRWVAERDPFVKLTARRAVLALPTTQDTAKRLSNMKVRNIQILPESALQQEEIEKLASYTIPNNLPFRFVSMGRLLHWKGFHLSLRSFAEANLPNSEYWIFGNGAELNRLKSLAQELGIANKVKFWGKLSRDESLNLLQQCHALVHPSLHDSGGWVCLEAMAAGRPVICLDIGGPSVQVTQKTGFKIRANNPEQVVQDMANAMKTLAQDLDLVTMLGRKGQQRVQELFNLETKGQLFYEVQREFAIRNIDLDIFFHKYIENISS
jgi:glycosyltransferase involved in cell wall biosynthesis